MDPLGVLQAVVGLALVAFAPGYAWVRVVLVGVEEPVARIVASVAISIALVTLSVYLANLVLRVPIGPATVAWCAIIVTAAPLVHPAGRTLARWLDAAVS